MRNGGNLVAKSKFSVKTLCIVSVMAALCFAATYFLRIELPGTRVHFGAAICMLAALLFGPLIGGLTGAIGMSMTNLLGTALGAVDAPFTFIMRFVQGFFCGWIAWGGIKGGKPPSFARSVFACAAAAAIYFALFMIKSYFELRLFGNTHEATLAIIAAQRVWPSVMNAITNPAVAVLVAPVLRRALIKSRIDTGHNRAPV